MHYNSKMTFQVLTRHFTLSTERTREKEERLKVHTTVLAYCSVLTKSHVSFKSLLAIFKAMLLCLFLVCHCPVKNISKFMLSGRVKQSFPT